MLDWTTSTLRIGLSKNVVSVLQTSRWRGPRVMMLKEAKFFGPTDSAPQLMRVLESALAEIDLGSGWASIVLSDEWVHYFGVTLPANVTRLADCREIAALRFQRLYDLDPADWAIEASWSVSDDFMACAMPRWLIKALNEFAGRHGLHLTGIVPQFVCAWNRWHARIDPDSWFGLVHHNRITFSALRGKRPVDADTLLAYGQDEHDASWLEEQLTRNALVRARPAPTRIYLCGTLPPAWPTAPGAAFHVIPLKAPELRGLPSSPGVLLAMQGQR